MADSGGHSWSRTVSRLDIGSSFFYREISATRYLQTVYLHYLQLRQASWERSLPRALSRGIIEGEIRKRGGCSGVLER